MASSLHCRFKMNHFYYRLFNHEQWDEIESSEWTNIKLSSSCEGYTYFLATAEGGSFKVAPWAAVLPSLLQNMIPAPTPESNPVHSSQLKADEVKFWNEDAHLRTLICQKSEYSFLSLKFFMFFEISKHPFTSIIFKITLICFAKSWTFLTIMT